MPAHIVIDALSMLRIVAIMHGDPREEILELFFRHQIAIGQGSLTESSQQFVLPPVDNNPDPTFVLLYVAVILALEPVFPDATSRSGSSLPCRATELSTTTSSAGTPDPSYFLPPIHMCGTNVLWINTRFRI